MSNNVIQYTSRTFEAIINDINSDNELADKPNWWKRAIAGIGDVISMWNNALANNLLLRTAYTRKNVQLLLELIDYQMSAHSTANGIILFYIKDTAIFPFTINQSDLIAITTGTLAVSSKRFEARTGLTVNATSETIPFSAVNITNNTLTVTREYMTGERIRLITSGSLPTPLQINTNYYVIKVNSTTIKLATSLLNSINGIEIDITNQGTGNHTLNLYSCQVQVYQQQSVNEFSIGTSDGVSNFQEFNLSDVNILKDTLIVKVNSIIYNQVESLIESTAIDKVYRLFYNTDNSSKIQFGGNSFGEIPPAFDIMVSYAYGGGVESNVEAKNKINVYAGTNSNIDGVSNPTIITGGANPESIESAKIIAPILLKSRDRFVTDQDGEALSISFGGISLTKVIKNYFGILTCKVVNIATGGGNISAGQKSSLQAYLIDRTILQSIDVRVQDAIITAINITASAKILNSYNWTDVLPFFRLAFKLFLTETGSEIKLDYQSNGIESAVNKINIYFSESFTSADYEKIRILIINLQYRNFGDIIQESDIIAYVANFVEGIDYLIISSPLFPVSLQLDEITTFGTLTLSQIP